MADFDVYQFEDRVADLIAAHRRLAAENKALRQDYETLARRHAEARQRLQALLERLRALEEEAEAQRS